MVLTQPPTRSQLAIIIESVLNEVREPMASAPTRSIVKRSPIGGGVGVLSLDAPGDGDSKPEKMSSTVLLARDVISAAPACGAAASNMAATMTSDTAARRSAPRAASRTTATRHGIIRSNRSVRSARRPAVANDAARPTSPLEATPSKRRSATRRSGAAERRAARRRPRRSWPSPGISAEAKASRRCGVDRGGMRVMMPRKQVKARSTLGWHRRGVAQLGSAPALGAGGRGFESLRPDHAPRALELHAAFAR